MQVFDCIHSKNVTTLPLVSYNNVVGHYSINVLHTPIALSSGTVFLLPSVCFVCKSLLHEVGKQSSV